MTSMVRSAADILAAARAAGEKPDPDEPTPVPATTAGDILHRAERAGGKYATRALRIRTMLTDLSRDLDANAEAIAAKRRVEQLRVELAEAEGKLKKLKPAAPRSADTLSRTAKVRAWAKENNVVCPAFGKIPAAVLEAYEGRTP